jgi:K+ transporter
MELNKAIRKQKKSYKRFMLTMSFIFFILPLVLVSAKQFKLFFIGYLGLIEVLILVSMMFKTSFQALSYKIDLDRLKIKQGILGTAYNFSCNKVAIVHTEEREDGIDLVLITTTKLRNKKSKLVDKEFLMKHAVLSDEYNKVKKSYPESEYYYFIIRKGGFIKYKLLLDMYKNCVKAKFTDLAIENIKEWKS